MISTVLRLLTNPVLLLKPSFVSHSLTVTRGRRLWMRPYLASLYKRRLDQGPEPDRPRSIWINWNYESEIYSFGKRLGEHINSSTLKQAFITSSHIKKEQDERLKLGLTDDVALVDLKDNQQLAQLGDSAARSYIDLFLRRSFPHLPLEGVSAITRYLLTTDVLAYVANNLGVKDLVQTAEFPVSCETLSVVLKSIIGAIHHDQGKQRAELFVQDFILTQLIGKDIFDMWSISNAMGLLIDTLRNQGRSEPEPRLLWSTGSETILSSYIVGMYVDRQLIGQAPGETVSIAEEMAARDALRRLWRFEQSCRQLAFDARDSASDYTRHTVNTQ